MWPVGYQLKVPSQDTTQPLRLSICKRVSFSLESFQPCFHSSLSESPRGLKRLDPKNAAKFTC